MKNIELYPKLHLLGLVTYEWARENGGESKEWILWQHFQPGKKANSKQCILYDVLKSISIRSKG